jgi:hypothetical protein
MTDLSDFGIEADPIEQLVALVRVMVGKKSPAIPNTAEVIARFDDGRDLPVIAWDSEGYALIPSADGYLSRARGADGFMQIRPGQPKYPPRPVVPDYVPDEFA